MRKTLLFLILGWQVGQAQSQLKVVVPIGHTKPVTAMSVTPDDRFLISGGADNLAHLWSVESGRLLKTYRGTSVPISNIEISHSGSYFLLIGNNKLGLIYNFATGEVVDSCFFSSYNSKLVNSPSRDGFFWIGRDNELRMWTPGQASKILEPSHIFFSIAISPDGNNLLALAKSRGNDDYSYLYENAAFVPPVKAVLIGIKGGLAKFLRSVKMADNNQLAFSSDGAIALVGDHGNTVYAFSTSGAQLLFYASNVIWLGEMKSSEKLNLLKFHSYDGDKVWELSGNRVRAWNPVGDIDAFSPSGFDMEDAGAVISPGEINKSRYAIWMNGYRGKPLLIKASVVARFHGKKWLASAAGSEIHILDLESNKEVLVLKGLSTSSPNQLSFSSDNSLLAYKDFSTRVWNLKSGKLFSLPADTSSFSVLAGPGHGYLIQGMNGHIDIKNPETGKMITSLASKDSKSFEKVNRINVSGDFQYMIFNDTRQKSFLKKVNWNHPEFYDDYVPLTYNFRFQFTQDRKERAITVPGSAIEVFTPGSNRVMAAVMYRAGIGGPRPLMFGQEVKELLDKQNFISVPALFLSRRPDEFDISEPPDFLSISADGKMGIIVSQKLWRKFSIVAGDGSERIRETQSLDVWPTAVLFHPVQPLLAMADWRSNSVRTFATPSLKENGLFSGHTDQVTSLAFSSDGKWMASASLDNTVKLWDMADRKEIATIVAIGERDWVVLHPSGLFDATPGAMTQIYFSTGFQTIGLDQIKERFYEPNLLKKLLAGETLRTVSGLDRIDLFPRIQTTLDTVNAKLIVRLTDQGGGIGKTSLFINGKETIEDIRSFIAANQKAVKGQQTIVLDLSANRNLVWGDLNFIGVKAYNEAGYLASPAEKIYYKAPEKKKMLAAYEPNLFSLIVGVSDYANDALDLKYSSKDAQDVAVAVKTAGKRLFGDRMHITVLSSDSPTPSDKPTKENIIHALDAISSKAQPSDLLIIYFSGHGTNQSGDDGDFLYLTAEARGFSFSDPAIRQSSSLSSSELTEYLKIIPAQKQVLVFDACASGRVVENMLAKRDVPSSTLRALERMKDRTGTYIITGCAADAVSYEASRFGQGLLTYSLLSGMRGAALREDRFVDILKLFQYAKDEVPRLAENIGGIQEPKVFSPYGGESFDIGVMEADDKKLIPFTMAKPFFVRSSFQNETKLRDDLGLGKQVDDGLNELSQQGKDSPLIFIDAVDFPGAYFVSGRYRVEGSQLSLKMILFQNERTLRTFEKTFQTTDVSVIRKELTELISSAVR